MNASQMQVCNSPLSGKSPFVESKLSKRIRPKLKRSVSSLARSAFLNPVDRTMPAFLHSVSSFPSTGKAKPCFLSRLTRNSTLFLKKQVVAVSVCATSTTSKDVEIMVAVLKDLKNKKKISHQKLLDVYQIIVEMANRGCMPAPSQARTLIGLLYSRGFCRKAVRIVELMLRSDTLPDRATCTFVIVALTNKLGAYVYAIKLLDEMEQRGCTLDPEAYETLAKSLWRHASTCQALHYFERLLQKGQAQTILHILSNLLSAVHLHSADLAVSVLYQFLLRGREPSMVTYSRIVTKFMKENRAAEALELFSVLPPHMKPNRRTYTSLFSALGNQSRWREVEALFDSMMERGIQPDLEIYKALILVIANNGFAENALEIAEELVRHGLETDEWCFNPIIAQFCSERRVDMVHKCLESMERLNCPLSSGTYRAITVLCKKGMLDEAFNIFELLRQKHGKELQSFYDEVVLPSLCCNGFPSSDSRTLEAVRILPNLTQAGYTPGSQTVSHIVIGLCTEGLHEEAFNMFKMAPEGHIEPDASNYKMLISHLCEGRRADLAIIALDKMVRQRYKPTQSTYLNIIEAIESHGRKDIAKELLRELNARGEVSRENVEKLSVKFCLDDFELVR